MKNADEKNLRILTQSFSSNCAISSPPSSFSILPIKAEEIFRKLISKKNPIKLFSTISRINLNNQHHYIQN